MVFGATPVLASPDTKGYDDVTLSGGFQAGHFPDVWDLTACDLELSFTVDLKGVKARVSPISLRHAWAEFGVRQVGAANWDPTWLVEGKGVWLATDHDWAVKTFNGNADDDNNGTPNKDELDKDDKLILQKAGSHGEGDYNLPSTPSKPWANHRIWFDRDGVDESEAENPLAVDGATYNTGGTYDIVITLHATSDKSGTAYMTVNGLDQGFETDDNWETMELSPAGMTFTGDMTQMQVFYGLYGKGARHSVTFKDITVTGCPTTLPVLKFEIDHAKLDFKKKPDDDKVRLKGKLQLDLFYGGGVKISEDVTVTVDSLSETIPGGTMVEKDGKWEYKRLKGSQGNIKRMTINWENGKFDIRMDKADLTGVTNPVTISIQIGDDFGVEIILMKEKKKHHWDYKAHRP